METITKSECIRDPRLIGIKEADYQGRVINEYRDGIYYNIRYVMPEYLISSKRRNYGYDENDDDIMIDDNDWG